MTLWSPRRGLTQCEIAWVLLTFHVPRVIVDAAAVYTTATHGTDFVFALSLNQSGFAAFHMAASSDRTWMAAGFGTEMEGSLMFVAYPAATGEVIISPRLATGHSEPSLTTSISCHAVTTNRTTATDNKDTLAVGALCGGLSTWHGWQALSLDNPSQSFIWAVGPVQNPQYLSSGDYERSIQRHTLYGSFNMDLKEASEDFEQPQPNNRSGGYILQAASSDGGAEDDFDAALLIHACLMGIVWILVFPIGAALLRAQQQGVRWHGICQAIGYTLFLVGVAAGVKLSSEYNMSSTYRSSHQILGILIFVMLTAHLIFGLVNHRIYKQQKRRTWMGAVHRFLGPTLLALGIVDAYLGFDFAHDYAHILDFFIPAAIFMVMLYLAVGIVKRRVPQTTPDAEEESELDAFVRPSHPDNSWIWARNAEIRQAQKSTIDGAGSRIEPASH